MRIKLDLTSFLGDHRKNSMLLIDPKEQKTVRDVVNRILTLFKIDSVKEEEFALFSDDFYLHHDQSSHLLEGCDTLRLSRCPEDEAQAKQKKEKRKRKRKKDGEEEEESLDQTVQLKKKRGISKEREVKEDLEDTAVLKKKRKKKGPSNEEKEESEEIFIAKNSNKRDLKIEGKGHSLTKKIKKESYEEQEEEIVLVKEAPVREIPIAREIHHTKKLSKVVEPSVEGSSNSGEESSVESLKILTSSEGLLSKGLPSSEKSHHSKVHSLTKTLSPVKDSVSKTGVTLPAQTVSPTKSQISVKSQIPFTKVQTPAKESAKKVEATTSEEADISAVFQADCSEDLCPSQQPEDHSSQDSSSDEIMKVSGSESKNRKRRRKRKRKKPVRATSDDFINSSTKDEVPPTGLVDQQTASSSHNINCYNFAFQRPRSQIPRTGSKLHGRTHIIFDQDDDECQIESSKPIREEGQNFDDQGLKKNTSLFWGVDASKTEEIEEEEQSTARISSNALVPFRHSTPKHSMYSKPSDMDDISEISISSDSRTQPRIVRKTQEKPSTSSNFSNILSLMDQASCMTPAVYKRPGLRKVNDEVLLEKPYQEEVVHQKLSVPPNPIPVLDSPMNKSTTSTFHNIMAIENRKTPLIFHHQTKPLGGSLAHRGTEVPTSTVVSESETVVTKVTKSVAGLTRSESVAENVTKSEKLFTSFRKLPGVTTALTSVIRDLRATTPYPLVLSETASAVSVNNESSQLSADNNSSQSTPSSSTVVSPSASKSNIHFAPNRSESSPKQGKISKCEVSQVEVNLCEEGDAGVGDCLLKNSSGVQDKCLPTEEPPAPENVQEKEIKSSEPQPSSSVSKEEREDRVCQSGDAEQEETPVVDIVSDSEGKSPGHPKSLYDSTLPPDEAYKCFPLVESLPKKGEYLAVKILKLDENYSPTFSNYLRVQVLKVDGINVTLKYLDKDKNPSRKVTSSNELVDLTFEDDDFCVEQVDWRNIEVPRLLYP